MARKRAPAIIFIDEIDAIGQRRAGSGAVVSNDEREQTLNQLLAEMDGFEPASGIVVLAATNRPEVLDPALLRPGRFDRQVTIPLPNAAERAAILGVHAEDKKLAPDVDLNAVARGTPGFSGADLANLANEAAIFAVRDNRDVLTAADFERGPGPDHPRPPGGLQRAAAGGEARGRGARVRPRHRGGAVRARRPGGQGDDPAPGQTLGVTEQLPLVERHMYGRGLPDRLARRPPRRPGRRTGGHRPWLHRRGQRPGRGDRPGHQDGPGVRPVPAARPDRVPRGRVGVPRRGRPGPVQPPVRRGDPGGHRRGGLPAAARGRGTGDRAPHRAPRRLDELVALLLEEETVDGELRSVLGIDERAGGRSRVVAPELAHAETDAAVAATGQQNP